MTTAHDAERARFKWTTPPRSQFSGFGMMAGSSTYNLGRWALWATPKRIVLPTGVAARQRSTGVNAPRPDIGAGQPFSLRQAQRKACTIVDQSSCRARQTVATESFAVRSFDSTRHSQYAIAAATVEVRHTWAAARRERCSTRGCASAVAHVPKLLSFYLYQKRLEGAARSRPQSRER